MFLSGATDEYVRALRMGQKENRELNSAGLSTSPAVLDELLPDISQYAIEDLPAQDIPIERIIGTRSAGRISAFTPGFMPLLDLDSEFATKWISLCAAHLSDTGIREPVLCYEYLGDFYVQEGNKRVSVLKYFGAAKIPSVIKRVLPPKSSDPRIKAYYEFLDFYKVSKLYDIQFNRPGDFAKLLSFLGKDPSEEWSDRDRRSFSSNYHYFKEAFKELGGAEPGLRAEEALLLWLQVYPACQLGELSPKELKKSLAGLWEDVVAGSGEEPVKLHTVPALESRGFLDKLITPVPEHLNVALIHQRDAQSSPWTRGHEKGAQHLKDALADQVTVRSYFHADTAGQAEMLLDQAVADGAELVFTTTPPLLRSTLKAALKYPKVRFLNCSADTPLSSVRSYYCRTFEGKFITGVIAGAMAENDLIGYIGSYPIMGVPASINAFALGAQMTNPNAKILLEWSCLPGDATKTLLEKGIRIISNRDIPVQSPWYLEHGGYGMYIINAAGELVPLASPCWLWGKLYENVVRTILSGNWVQKKSVPEAVNYWWGMDSGAIDVELSNRVPESLRALVSLLMQDMREGRVEPFKRRIVSQDGEEKNDGTQSFSPLELLRMDWLCDNVIGAIPEYEELLPISKTLVRELGVHRDSIPPEKEGAL